MRLSVSVCVSVWLLLCLRARAETSDLPGEGVSDTNNTCGLQEFRCDDGRCLASWKCSSINNCEDLCSNRTSCREGEFQCLQTKKCIPIGWQCDGDPDCGTDEKYGLDDSDETQTSCFEIMSCPPNEHYCVGRSQCIPIVDYCNGERKCPQEGDKSPECQVPISECDKKKCEHACAITKIGPTCYCPEGAKPEEDKCVDFDECTLDFKCDQICKNTIGSFNCSCVNGYEITNITHCKAINDPVEEEASLIFSTQRDIKRIKLDGTPWSGNSSLRLLNSYALDFDYDNRSICYIQNKLKKSSLGCSSIDNFNDKWLLPAPSLFPELDSIHRIALDWISKNWYFVDDQREVIFLCNSTLDACDIILEVNLSKPSGIALDPTRGVMFFTKWGHSVPALERCSLNGSNRESLVTWKIVHPCGIAVDIPTATVYWIDEYLDFVEQVDYFGNNRRTLKRGHPVQSLYSVTVFELNLFVTSSQNHSIIRLNKPDADHFAIIKGNLSQPYSIHVFHRQKQPNVSHPCKIHNGGCEHLCVPGYKNKANTPYAICMCKPGFRLRGHGECVLVNESTFLIYGKGKPAMINAISMSPKQRHKMIIPITDLNQPTALDFDFKDQFIYYSDIQKNTIQRQHLNGTGRETILSSVRNGKYSNTKCEGIAIDWINNLLYWTDELLHRISVLSLSDFEKTKTLIYDTTSNPRSIVLDPKRGIMFWSHWRVGPQRNGKIESAWMDGTNRIPIVTTDIQWPNGLTIDYSLGKLYWCDVFLDKIERINLDGTQRTIIQQLEKSVSPYSLAFHANFLFWTEYKKGTIRRLHLTDNTLDTLSVESPPLFDIKVYEDRTDIGSNDCSSKNCTEFCLATPKGSECSCSDGMKFDSTNSSCIPVRNYRLPSRCQGDGLFQCTHRHCIDQNYVCDGDIDCEDGSDEDARPGGICENIVCQENQFQCDLNRCLSISLVCDGEKDCVDGSDEEPVHCHNSTCSPMQFRCKISGRCIPMVWKCDIDLDCGDGDNSDEDASCTYPECEANQFTCDNKECIQSEYYCNGYPDCKDRSDEKNCGNICDPKTMIYCPAHEGCFPIKIKCDGVIDCPDGSDEVDCVAEKIPTPRVGNRHHNTNNKEYEMCEKNEFQCKNLDCIRKEFRCDTRVDCLDGSDEENCTFSSTTETPLTVLPEPTSPTSCEPPSRKCDNETKCITPDKLCDNRDHCLDGTDEGLRCSERLCDRVFECSHMCYNTPEGFICVCPNELHLQPDGMHCSNYHPCNQWGVCSQKCQPHKSKHKCICNDGYQLANDGFTCKSTDVAVPYVIFSNRHELRSIDLHTMQDKPLIISLKNTIALDFHYTKEANIIYWTDAIDDKIYRGTLVGGLLGKVEVIVQTGLTTAEGLAVDWVAENLYWVESTLDQIEVSKLNGSFRKTLIAGDMESPRAIALDPRDGTLFWTDWETSAPRIERCTLAGRSRRIVVQVDKVSDGAWPNGLTLDYEVLRIYWIDARSNSIHTVTYDGLDHRIILKGRALISHPFAIALYENYVYWTDWRTNSVIRANKWNGSDVFALRKTYTQPFDITIMHPSRQPKAAVNPCGNNNGGCSHLCLLETDQSFQCACPHVMILGLDQKNCIVNDKFLLFSRHNEVRGVDLTMPYYHIIPTISSRQILAPQQLDFDAKTKSLYWSDVQTNEIKKTGLTSGPTTSIIDTGIENPAGFAIDWISELMFFSSSGNKEQISVCTLKGEYTTVLISNDIMNVSGISLAPSSGKLFWGHIKNESYVIERSNMDGSDRIVLDSESVNSDLSLPQCLAYEVSSQRLYWVNINSFTIQYYDFLKMKSFKVPLPRETVPTAAIPYFDKIYYASAHDQAIHSCDKTNCSNDEILRNKTANVLSMRIYDSDLQKGTNVCSKNRGGCQHLCLPTDSYTRKCACATGYYLDPSHPNNCIGFEEFVFYSINWEIKGLKLNGSDEIAVLGPISHVSLATSIDFHAATDHIYWTDSDHGTINRIKRDGTERQVLIEQSEIVENTPVDWLSGLSIDWIASNMYWIDPKRNVIEVARLNGSSRYVILANYLETPSALAVDPMVGFLFYACGSSVYRAYLDGSNSIMLFNATAPTSITDISLDYGNKKVYWTETSRSSQSIMEMFYNGSSPIVSLNHNLNNPSALTIHKGYVYWIDTIHELGSIKKAPISNVSNYQVLLKGVGDSLKDIQIFSKQRQKGTNPCAGPSNGGCEKLCLFNGHNVTCACPHGKVGPDGKKCISYNTFLMYSLMVRIESIHMFDENNLNAPYPAIQNRELRNAIALSFDYHSSRLFYSDTKTSTINAVFFNGTGHTVIVDHQGSAEGLAFDPLSKYLFWTCNNNASINKLNLTNFFQNDSPSAKHMNHSIRESLENNSEKKSSVETVIKLETNDKPRGIAIDSCQMKIYWTNWNSHSPSIQRAHTNGYNQESIITTDIHIPNALTLDHKAQKLYWIDARLDKIERTEYDGTHRFIITKGTAAHPFDLAVYGDSIFWTDWELRAVIRADKISGLNIVKLRKDVPRPMGIVAVAEDTDNCMLNPCMQLNGGCSDICSLNAYGEVICKCFPNRHLDHSATRCLESTTNCEGGDLTYYFACTEGDCIPLESTCDGINHCADGSDEDERFCATRKCSEPFHQCNDNRCIPFYKVCNGENDCGDGSDEASCSCKDDFFKCNSGQCISADMLCDFKADCPDVSDEKNCALTDCFSPRAMAGRTPPDNIPLQRCLYTTPCVHPTWKCDGQNDCLDNSDEENCTISVHPMPAGITCSSDQFKCAFGLCISAQWRCDSEDDCYDGKYSSSGISSDEINCGHQCRPNQFACGSDECIPSNWQCDGSPDCTDASDESTHCSERTCSENEYRCGKTPRCITKAWLCDGEVDCVGGEDENITAGCKPSTCTPHHLQCANGNCISKHYYCDGDNDCGDGSDEPINCSELDKNEKCEQGKLPCRSGICISESRFCDGWDDCKDGTDEDPNFCNKNGESGYCSVSEFLCSNDLCINNTLICDGQNDCGDFSDEIKCNINECLDSTICAHHCTDLKIGYTCSCRKGYRLAENNKHLCLDIDECMENPCGQICRNTQGSYVCSCQDGFTLNPDKINCRANSRTAATLIFSNRYYIRTMNLANGAPTLIAHNLTNAVALDFDWAGQCVYWSDVTAQGSNIKRLCDMNSTNIEKNSSSSNYQVLHSSNLQNPDGLAVDWIGRNIYWCDKGHDTIEASRLDGRHRKILMNKGLQEPRAIALDPKHGMMYWSDWGDQAHIGRAGMDGSNPTIIINSILGWPNALSISHESRELYFADAKEDYIAVADLDGKNVRFLFSRAKNPSLKLHHIFAIAVWEGYIYWSDWETKTIERCERHVNLKYLRENAANHSSLNQSCRTMAKLIHKPMDIRIYHPYRQRPVPNRSLRCAELNCSGLCLLTPGSDGPIAKCACPESFILADDGFSCNPNCTTAHFVCAKALKCIPFWWRCDTQDDCGDGSDEPETCRHFHCTPGEFQCNGNQCIHPSQLCNGVDDCGDNSDEIDCDKFTCLSSQFKCKGNGTVSDRCIPSSERCDGHNNCPNGEDEIDCPSETCSPGHFVCNNSKCIPKVWLCDKDNDCGDNSDETVQCEERKCPADLFRCQSGRCIPQSWQCDGEKDCPDGEDEPLSCDPQTVCDPTYFKCKNNKCIPGRWHCDYEDDCGDKSDEINCVPRNCSESEYRCADGQCVRGTHRCDGQYNCHDRSDELGCNILCNAFEFQCQDPKTCILSEWRCDGDIDCSDGSDEFGCKIDTNRTSVSPCEPHMFFCPPPQGRCIPNDWLCDAALDCVDGSDENDSMCSLRACLPSTQRCNNHKCVPSKYWCDGTDDCGDGSDENTFLCKNSNLCAKDQFKCSNTYCIAKNLTCNGEDNCGDMSDELDCKHHTCSLGACSQLCIEKKEQLYSCKCHTGYHSQTYDHATHTCIAFGDPAKLIATGDSDLQILGAYKRGEDYHTELLYKNQTSSRFKIGHHDILWRPKEIIIFATDQRHRRIFRLTVNMSSVDSQNVFSPSMDKQSNISIIVNNMTEPRGIAVEWISKKLYWTEAGGNPRGAILVSTLEGAMRTTLITGLYDPQDIVVDPKSKYMIWSRTGESPCIEKASLSGSSRKMLVDRNIRWPIGLALDIPASRLYWSDPKTSTLESIKFDGTDRHLIKSFSFVEKPNKLVVFEDTIFYSTYFGQSIKKIDKFGKGNSSYLSHSLSEISDLSILQENLQDQNVTNYCDINPCSENALCLLSFESPGRSCICPDGWLADNKTHNSDLRCYIGSATFVSCSLRCTQGGRCEVADGVEKCSCFPGYTGLRCEQYRCARYCLHGGVCMLRHDGSLECSCLRNWTGKRCEISKCKTCKSESNCTNECPCPPPYSGANCDICGDKKCTDGKVCQYQSDNSSLVCECPLGWTGHRCETNLCKGYCADDGYCKINEKGLPECHCPRGRAGERCEEILCKEVCKNKGVCHISGGSVVCACPAQYTGQHCEELLCLDDSCKTTTEEQPAMSPREGECRVNGAESYMCQNGGSCTKTFHSSVCRCPPQWGGPYCQIYIGHDNPCSSYCKNQAVCTVDAVAGPAHCHCLEGWRGDKCENKDLCWNWCHPDNGICSITALGEPKCTCMNDFGGPHCMESLQQIADEQTRRIWTGLGVSVILALLVIGAAAALFMIYRRRGKSFSHSRLQDNIEINNPMYLQGHDEDLDPLDRGFNLNPDKNGGHFANPVYDSIYKGLGNADAASTTPLAESGPNLHVGLGADECSGLLQNTQESDPLS